MKKIAFIFATACCLANAQSYQWAKAIGGIASGNLPNIARSVTTDAAGNVYMTGNFAGTNVNFNPGLGSVILSAGSTDIFFAKYAAGGNCTWAKSIFGAGGTGQSIVTDPGGNVYVTGYFFGTAVDFDPGPGTATLSSAASNDIFIAKYDAGGNYLWAKVIGGSSPDFGMSISTDATGNAYITGRFQSTTVDFDPGPGVATLNSAGGADIFFAKYDPSGNYLWAKTVGSAGNDISYAISTDGSGNPYITGSFQGGATDFDPGPGTATLSSAGTDIFFAKYDTNGNYLWAKSVFGSSAGYGASISADAAGNAWISGIYQGTNVDFDPGPGVASLSAGTLSAMFFAKYDPSGNYLWAKSVANAGGACITKDVAGKVYVTGGFGPNTDFDPGPGTATLSYAGSGDIFFAKYDANGNYIWARSVVDPASDYGSSIAIDGSDNVYIAGAFNGTNVDFDPGPGTATLSSTGNSSMYLAKYGYCSTQKINQASVCAGGGYGINGHIYTTSGTYNDTLYSALGCDSIVVTQLTVLGPQPTITISSSSTLCMGSTSTLTATGAVTYTWSTGAQTPVLVVTPTNVIQYIVSGTGTGGCNGSDTINVIPSPTIGISGKQTVCKGAAVFLAASGANSYTWSSGVQTPTILATLTTTTIYTVTGSSTNTPCKSQQTVTVTVSPCLGINPNPGGIQMTVYPNPAKTELFYTVNSNGTHRYKITDFNGTMLAEGEQHGNKVMLDLSPYQAGIYNLTITIGNSSRSTRFIIQKTD